mmetsp:Transcript_4061/g.6249  ORF Transcript_4061/g.6249 Transcript_4061/m.6249 type:complete len:404 (+) Transcript_4061:76-1287(+)
MTTATTTEQQQNHQTLLSIGILGAAQIARKNVAAICHNQKQSLCQLTAIASRSNEKAQQFVQEHCSKAKEVRIFSGTNAYDELLSSSLVDAVYIPLPTSLHKEWVRKALNHGKHVLVEKPVTLTMEDFQEFQELANQKQKYVLDGTMFVHNPRTRQLLEYLRNNATNDDCFGTVLRMDSTFSFLGDEEFFANNIRIKSGGDPFGCVGDLGWYSIRMALLVMKTQQHTAKKVKVAHYQLNQQGVPIDLTGLVYFYSVDCDHNATPPKLLSFHCSFLHPLRQRMEVVGSKQSMILNDLVIPQQGRPSLHYELRSQSLTACDEFAVDQTQNISCETVAAVSQETLMWRHMSQMCRAMEEESSSSDESSMMIQRVSNEMSHMSYETQKVVLAVIESIRKDGAEIDLS